MYTTKLLTHVTGKKRTIYYNSFCEFIIVCLLL